MPGTAGAPTASRIANALITDARPVRGTNFVILIGIWPVRKFYGGLWVGGRLSLFPDRLEFSANDLNRRMTEGVLDLTIPLDSIRAVQRRFGIVTGIIDVITDTGPNSFRCYGAARFTEMLRSCLKEARPEGSSTPLP
ncbi:hypothetical protein [Dongia sp. agr-C8]